MLFSKSNLSVEIIGVFQFKRKNLKCPNIGPRSFDAISIRTQGSGTLFSKSSIFKLKKGDILYIPKGIDYVQETLSETIIAIHFILHHHSGKSLETIHPNDPEACIAQFQAIFQEWENRKIGYEYRCASMFYSLLEVLHQQACFDIVEDSPASKIQKAVDYIHEYFTENNITIGFLAGLSGLSEVYFRKLFNKVFGTSPAKYINSLRLEYAAQLLQCKYYKVNEVAEKAGFNDAKYFSTAFKQKFQMSPYEYMNHWQEIIWEKQMN